MQETKHCKIVSHSVGGNYFLLTRSLYGTSPSTQDRTLMLVSMTTIEHTPSLYDPQLNLQRDCFDGHVICVFNVVIVITSVV